MLWNSLQGTHRSSRSCRFLPTFHWDFHWGRGLLRPSHLAPSFCPPLPPNLSFFTVAVGSFGLLLLAAVMMAIAVPGPAFMVLPAWRSVSQAKRLLRSAPSTIPSLDDYLSLFPEACKRCGWRDITFRRWSGRESRWDSLGPGEGPIAARSIKCDRRGMHLTPETPIYSMRGCGGLPADAGGV